MKNDGRHKRPANCVKTSGGSSSNKEAPVDALQQERG